jgi:hypothetical protein
MRYEVGRFHRPMRRSTESQLASLVSLGDGSTITIDFSTMSSTADLTSRGFTFGRGSIGTRINANGFVETMSNNVARFDYDPITRAPRGIIIEASAANLCCWSETFATSGGVNNWADSNITRNSTTNTDPANGTTALRITASAPNATILNNHALSSASRTFSIWLRRVSGTGDIQATLNGGTTWTTQAITSSWVRYEFTATTTAHVGIRIVSNSDSIELWGAQTETGSVSSTYIPTSASTVTRSADDCTMTGTAFSNWFSASQNQGTIFVSGSRNGTGGLGRLISINDNSATNVIDVSLGGTGRFQITSLGVSQALVTAGTVSRNVEYRQAATFEQFYAQLAINGALGTAVTPGMTFIPLNRLMIGKNAAAAYMNGRVKLFKFWPYRLADTTLQSITT